MKNEDRIILEKIIGYIEDVAQFVSDLDFDSFLSDKKTLSACAFAVSQMGEIVKEISDDTRNAHPTIPWKSIRGMRNRIVHDYENVDYAVLWSTIKTSLPELKEQLTTLLEMIPSDADSQPIATSSTNAENNG